VESDRSRSNAAPIHGRSSVLALISGALDGVERGKGRVISIFGPTGIGKSTVLGAAIRLAKSRGYRVAEARAIPRDTPVPYDLVRDLLPLAAGQDSDSDAKASALGLPPWLVLGDQTSVVSGFPTVAVLPEGETPVENRILTLFEVERSMIDLGRRLLHAQLERVLLKDSQTTPVMITVDDLHHTDRDSLEFLRSLAAGIQDRRLLLVATLDSNASSGGMRDALIESITKGPSVEAVQLSGLSVNETAEVIRDTRPDPPPPPEYVQAVHERSKGVPAAIQQLARRYRESIPPPEKSNEEGGVPGGASVGLGSFPDETVRILTYGAVGGGPVDIAGPCSVDSSTSRSWPGRFTVVRRMCSSP
jgi:hypothetical protein